MCQNINKPKQINAWYFRNLATHLIPASDLRMSQMQYFYHSRSRHISVSIESCWSIPEYIIQRHGRFEKIIASRASSTDGKAKTQRTKRKLPRFLIIVQRKMCVRVAKMQLIKCVARYSGRVRCKMEWMKASERCVNRCSCFSFVFINVNRCFF